MKCVEDCMHVELQVLCDSHGDCRILGARDCSVQRRFQKLVEESPPPLLEPGNFLRLADSVSSLFKTVGYCGAGTAEFLFRAESKEAFFLEVNCRLQVEHVVTEKLFPGLNLPLAQVAIAAGVRLGAIRGVPRAHSLRGAGGPMHVVAARVLAEEPTTFLPQTGTISRLFALPASGYFSLSAGEVRSSSDSQIGHLVASGET
jgi:acetyl/propionyl-CoA carboxylase alpha subunit